MLRSLFIAVAAGLATVLAGEIVCRVLPVSTATMRDYAIDPDLLTYPVGHRWTVATGWDLRNVQQLHSNNVGFAADIDFLPNPQALALIGDSFVEASMLKPSDRPGAQLAAQLQGRRPVYGLGSPGTALLDYAQRVRFASQRLQVRDFVIWLEPGDARQALCGSGNVHSRCLDPRTLEPRIERLPEASPLKRWLRHSALANYLIGQLKFDPARLWASAVPGAAGVAKGKAVAAPVVSPAAAEKLVDAVLDRFAADIAPYAKGRLLFIVDGHRGDVPAQPAQLDLERSRLVQQLAARGYEVLDLEPLFAAHRKVSRLSLDVGPYDGHLNAMGVQLVVAAVAARWTP
jgi:hypothetical protein